MVRFVAPGPVIVTPALSETLICPLVRVIVPVAVMLTISAPAPLSASLNAWRKLPAPESFVLITVDVAACDGNALAARPMANKALLRRFLLKRIVNSIFGLSFMIFRLSQAYEQEQAIDHFVF